MKIGDIVQQRGDFIKGNIRVGTSLGIVLKIREFPDHMKTSRNGDWTKVLGRGITVLWSSGKIHENFAESALVVVS